jgi:hypothetical protein
LLACSGCLVAVLLAAGGVIWAVTALVQSANTLVNDATSWWDKESNRSRDWETVGQFWRPPPVDAGPEQLFPDRVGNFTRGSHDEQADFPLFDIRSKGRRALYRGPGGQLELFVYRLEDPQREALVSRVSQKVQPPKDKPDGSRSIRSSSRGQYLIYGYREGMARQHDGMFWWSQGWLFHAHSTTGANPEEFLKQYLTDVNRLVPKGP